jgi:glycerol-3-phosphate dehydrogenase
MPSERKGGTKDSTQRMCNQAARIIRRRRQKEIVGPKAKQDVTEVMISQIMLAETNQEERAFSRFY